MAYKLSDAVRDLQLTAYMIRDHSSFMRDGFKYSREDLEKMRDKLVKVIESYGDAGQIALTDVALNPDLPELRQYMASAKSPGSQTPASAPAQTNVPQSIQSQPVSVEIELDKIKSRRKNRNNYAQTIKDHRYVWDAVNEMEAKNRVYGRWNLAQVNTLLLALDNKITSWPYAKIMPRLIKYIPNTNSNTAYRLWVEQNLLSPYFKTTWKEAESRDTSGIAQGTAPAPVDDPKALDSKASIYAGMFSQAKKKYMGMDDPKELCNLIVMLAKMADEMETTPGLEEAIAKHGWMKTELSGLAMAVSQKVVDMGQAALPALAAISGDMATAKVAHTVNNWILPRMGLSPDDLKPYRYSGSGAAPVPNKEDLEKRLLAILDDFRKWARIAVLGKPIGLKPTPAQESAVEQIHQIIIPQAMGIAREVYPDVMDKRWDKVNDRLKKAQASVKDWLYVKDAFSLSQGKTFATFKKKAVDATRGYLHTAVRHMLGKLRGKAVTVKAVPFPGVFDKGDQITLELPATQQPKQPTAQAPKVSSGVTTPSSVPAVAGKRDVKELLKVLRSKKYDDYLDAITELEALQDHSEPVLKALRKVVSVYPNFLITYKARELLKKLERAAGQAAPTTQAAAPTASVTKGKAPVSSAKNQGQKAPSKGSKAGVTPVDLTAPFDPTNLPQSLSGWPTEAVVRLSHILGVGDTQDKKTLIKQLRAAFRAAGVTLQDVVKTLGNMTIVLNTKLDLANVGKPMVSSSAPAKPAKALPKAKQPKAQPKSKLSRPERRALDLKIQQDMNTAQEAKIRAMTEVELRELASIYGLESDGKIKGAKSQSDLADALIGVLRDKGGTIPVVPAGHRARRVLRRFYRVGQKTIDTTDKSKKISRKGPFGIRYFETEGGKKRIRITVDSFRFNRYADTIRSIILNMLKVAPPRGVKGLNLNDVLVQVSHPNTRKSLSIKLSRYIEQDKPKWRRHKTWYFGEEDSYFDWLSLLVESGYIDALLLQEVYEDEGVNHAEDQSRKQEKITGRQETCAFG